MNQLKEYFIQFSGLKLGKHQFDFQIDNTFFEAYEFSEFNASNINVKLVLDKKSTLIELHFSHSGSINVPCDLSNVDFYLPVKGKLNLLIKFGEEYNDENENFVVLPHGEFQINVAQFIYEMIVLSIPSKRIHPGIKDGTLETTALEILNKLAPKKEVSKTNDIDPRWEDLKKLLIDKDKK